MDPVFAPFSHFTFPHTFSTQFLGGIIPKNYYHWDEYKISSFGKLKHCFSHNRPQSTISHLAAIITNYPLYHSSHLASKSFRHTQTLSGVLTPWHTFKTFLGRLYPPRTRQQPQVLVAIVFPYDLVIISWNKPPYRGMDYLVMLFRHLAI